MKNQNDLIAAIVATVLMLVGVVLCFTVFKRDPVQPTPPETVAVAVPPLPADPPVMAASLPQGSSRSGGGGGMPTFGGGAFGGGRNGPPTGMGAPAGLGSVGASGGGGGGGNGVTMTPMPKSRPGAAPTGG